MYQKQEEARDYIFMKYLGVVRKNNRCSAKVCVVLFKVKKSFVAISSVSQNSKRIHNYVLL
jgi:hypothetical protein